MKSIYLFFNARRGIFFWCEVDEAEKVVLKPKKRLSRVMKKKVDCFELERLRTRLKIQYMQNFAEL
jgi:hypothetical protein